MALGKVAATGAQPEFYEYIGERDSRPIIPLSPLLGKDEWKERIRDLILNPERLTGMSEEGRRIVEQHNDVSIVAQKVENHWHKILG